MQGPVIGEDAMAKTNTVRKTSTQKASRFSIRASATQKRVIAEAARIKDTTISAFVLEQSLTAAQQVIADQVQFRLFKVFLFNSRGGCPTVLPTYGAMRKVSLLLWRPWGEDGCRAGAGCQGVRQPDYLGVLRVRLGLSEYHLR
jgi:hypothetical protein